MTNPGRLFALSILPLVLFSATGATLAARKPEGQGEKDGYYWYQKSLLSLEAKLYEQSLDELSKAIKIEPKSPQYRYQQAIVNFALARWDRAEESLQAALVADAYYTEAHNLLGAVLSEKGDRAGALAEFQKVLADRNYATPEKVWVNIALLQEQMGNLEEAVTSYRRALDASNGYMRAHYGLAQVLDRMQRWDESIAEYAVAAKEYESSPEFQYKFGLACFRAGRKLEAREHLELVVRRAPGSTDASKAEDLLKLIN
jgi:tetratricopeptide (TPR) repeat protein